MAGAATATGMMKTALRFDPTGTDGGLEEYRRYLQDLAEGPYPSVTAESRSNDYAAVMVAELARHAAQDLQILSRDLSNEIYGAIEVLQAISDFIRRGGKITVLHENPLADDNRLRMVLTDWETSAAARGMITVKHVPSSVQAGYLYNFDLADRKSFRFKPDKDGDLSVAQFNEASFGATLAGFFQAISTAS